ADNEMLLFNLDINGISVSGGSACSSGSNVGSHVLSALGAPAERGSVRFSFSKFNTEEEVDYVVDKLAEIYSVKAGE
ncbi:MAG: aminotransferase class V-fold PLP-dependent enzyme, partial [Cyclobacteriaceae bacterium]|nr:aminotransferase class V-fold PLP-dependent enzyme [Cyclobacteriaceae bacterium]